MNFIDLFAGAGGLSEGFINAGYKPVAHVEMDKAACMSLRTRTAFHYLKQIHRADVYYDYLRNEITREKLYSEVPKSVLESIINLPIGPEYNQRIYSQINKCRGESQVDLIIGGPPCQAYSLVGRARSENNMEGDPRNYLFVEYAKYLRIYKPKFFLFENVFGLLSAKGGQYLDGMRKLFAKAGYEMELFKVDASNFGVLQKRKRLIIIGWNVNLSPSLPNLESVRPEDNYKIKDLFSDLPKIQAGGGIDKYYDFKKEPSDYLYKNRIRKYNDVLTQHVARSHTDQDKEIYREVVKKWRFENSRLNYNELRDDLKTHNNRSSFFDRFKVVADDLAYSHTVVAHIAKDGHYYIHPDLKQNRSISIREAARLQSFPDDYYFEGVREGRNRTAAFKQIGNAVPPLMAEKIAKMLAKCF